DVHKDDPSLYVEKLEQMVVEHNS
ncbi:uncharacterized protein METZ01_LOCUS158076, partial [marine metagenome]